MISMREKPWGLGTGRTATWILIHNRWGVFLVASVYFYQKHLITTTSKAPNLLTYQVCMITSTCETRIASEPSTSLAIHVTKCFRSMASLHKFLGITVLTLSSELKRERESYKVMNALFAETLLFLRPITAIQAQFLSHRRYVDHA